MGTPVDPVRALKNSNFLVRLILSTTDLPTFVMVSLLTDLTDFRDISYDPLAFWVSCSMLKNISWADRTSAFCCCDDDTPADKGGDKGSVLEPNILDGGEEQRGVAMGVGGLGPLPIPYCDTGESTAVAVP